MKHFITFLVSATALALMLSLTGCNLEEFLDDAIAQLDEWDEYLDPRPVPSGGADNPDAGLPGLPGPPDDFDEAPRPSIQTLAEGVRVVGIEAFQTLETTLVEGGRSVGSTIPLIAGRETLFRVLVSTDQGWTPREVTLVLELTDPSTGASQKLSASRHVVAGSTHGDRASAFEVNVPWELMTTRTVASFQLLGAGTTSVDSAASSTARWPHDGSSMHLNARDSTGTLHVVLVPMRFDTDGSGRLPDTSPEQIARYERLLRAVFPIHELRLEVREAISYTGPANWGDYNLRIRNLKLADGADEAYYYGLINPRDTFAQHCAGGCTAGQAFLVSNVNSTSYRVGSGLGFTGEGSAWTFVHEIGHMLGRGHAPCGGPASTDANYPHNGGLTGIRGWDARNDKIFGADVPDFMGYCGGAWISDYTYLGALERLEAAHNRQPLMGLSTPTRWRYVSWNGERAPKWGDYTMESNPATGEWARARFMDSQGRVLKSVDIPYIVFAHDGDRSVLVPDAPQGAVRVQIEAPSMRFDLWLS